MISPSPERSRSNAFPMLVILSSVIKVWARTQHAPSFGVIQTAVRLHLRNQTMYLPTVSFRVLPPYVLWAYFIKYNAKVVELFKCWNKINTQVMLNSHFKIEGIDCSFSSAVTATLLYGRFLWKNPLSPSSLAALVISSESIFLTDTLHEGMVLDHSTKFDISAASLSKLTKT